MKHRSEGATALVGMAGFVVGAQIDVDGELWLWVETTAHEVGCGSCGTMAVGHGRRQVKVRDLPVSGRPVVLVWSKRLWRCPDPDCATVTWSEASDAIGPRASLTARARAEIARRVGHGKEPVARVADEFGVGWHTAWAAVVEHGVPQVVDPARLTATPAVGIDEHCFARGRIDRRARWASVIADVAHGRVLDVVEGHDQGPVRAWFAAQDPAWLADVEVVCCDPYNPYRSAITRPGGDGTAPLAHAAVVADGFHIVGLGNDRVLKTRLRVQRATTGHRGRRGDPLYGIRRLLMVGAERLTPTGRARLEAGLAAGDPHGEVREAWEIKEQIRGLYRTTGAADAVRHLDTVIDRCRASQVPECRSLVRTLTSWRTEIAAGVEHAWSNATTEALNLGIEELIRRARGFRNFNNYRIRVLLAYSVECQTRPVARIRGRQPRLIA